VIPGDAAHELELAELAGRIGCAYVKQGLSPPFALREAIRSWRGLRQDEIMAIIAQHFEQCRRFYVAGCGDAHFAMVRAAISKALEAKHPRPTEPVRPRRRPRGLQRLHHAGGRVDIYDDRDVSDAGQEDDQAASVERPFGLPGYEHAGEPIGEDDEADA